MKTILSIIGIIGSVMIMTWAWNSGLNESERLECLKWRKEAVEYPLWHSTEWQREQCRVHGLQLPK
jgi:hypothetical protein